ncbi:hypothetical protein BBP40_004525 [Aspergillus hancockii]|nr:hypothetical protein BBP40_004525 [Aspergillus hancockii]
MNFEFFHDLLDDVQIEIPLFFVNREARGIALPWNHKQGLKVQFHKDKQSLIFVRPFEPSHDTLYVPFERWDEFMREPSDRMFELDLMGLSCPGTYNTRIAVPERLLQNDKDPFSEIFYYWSLKKSFVILDTPPDLQPEDDELKVQRRWEIKNTQNAMFIWNDDHSVFQWESGKDNGDKALCKQIKEASNKLVEELIDVQERSFEVRCVTCN